MKNNEVDVNIAKGKNVKRNNNNNNHNIIATRYGWLKQRVININQKRSTEYKDHLTHDSSSNIIHCNNVDANTNASSNTSSNVSSNTSSNASSNTSSNTSSNADVSTNTIPLSKLMATTAACIGAACITYPAELYRLSFTNQSLSVWDFESKMKLELKRHYHQHQAKTLSSSLSSSSSSSSSLIEMIRLITDKNGIVGIGSGGTSSSGGNGGASGGPFAFAFSQQNKQKQKIRIVLSPILRLFCHEGVLTLTTQTAETATYTKTDTNNINDNHHQSFKNQMKIGAIAGICQALVLCPLELQRANQLMIQEEYEKSGKTFHHWKQWMKLQFMEGGWMNNPQERRNRAFNAIGVLALREIVFSISFFPLFYGGIRYLNGLDDDDVDDDNNDDYHQHYTYYTPGKNEIECNKDIIHWSKSKHTTIALNTMCSGILSGLICSLAVTPMDVYKTYMLYSREQWSVWAGKNVVGPPLRLLFRGLTLQTFVFGPTFGIVATIYELT